VPQAEGLGRALASMEGGERRGARYTGIAARRIGAPVLIPLESSVENPMKILIVEDNSKLARALLQAFVEEGYHAEHAADGPEALEKARARSFDVVLLDWMLPGVDGLMVCRGIREVDASVAILMLTARGEVPDRVAGLDAGADDYLSKPFELQELLARIRALARRKGAKNDPLVRVGRIAVHREDRCVLIGDERIELTAREHALLMHLIRASDRVVSRRELLEQVWRLQFDPGTNVVDVQVRRLREKLGANGRLIETVRGMGYRIAIS
jgi:two-component system OmpR family response regulator